MKEAVGQEAAVMSDVEHRGLKPTVFGSSTIYHVWFSTKNRRRVLEGDVADTAKQVMWQVANERSMDLIELELMPDHAHLLLAAESAGRLSWCMKLLKGQSAYEVFRAYDEFKIDAHTNSLWQDGFKSRPVPAGQVEVVRLYIQTQDQRLEKYEH
jgi:putative transposase